MPVPQSVLALPITLRVLLAVKPELVAPMLLVVQRVVTGHLLGQRCAADRASTFVDEGTPTDEELHLPLQMVI